MKPAPGQLPLERPQPYPLAVFDIEIAKEVPDGEDWSRFRPFGISCAAIAMEGTDLDPRVEFFTDSTPDIAGRLLGRLMALSVTHAIVGFNSASFDWDVLAEETGWRDTCAKLCLGHYDLIHAVLCNTGYKKSLDSCCKGMGVTGKTHVVHLKDGTVIESMSGKDAPRLWAEGEHFAVLNYLRGDVLATLELAMAMRNEGKIAWVTSSGRPRSASLPRLFTVAEALEVRMPNQSWMDPPWPSPARDMEWAGAQD
jgi:hypothetical protein